MAIADRYYLDEGPACNYDLARWYEKVLDYPDSPERAEFVRFVEGLIEAVDCRESTRGAPRKVLPPGIARYVLGDVEKKLPVRLIVNKHK